MRPSMSNFRQGFNYSVYILIVPLVISFSLLAGCNFGSSGGLGAGLPTNLGVYCLRSATRYTATPTQPTLPLTEQDCENSIKELAVQWKFLRTDIPNATPLVANNWDVVDAVTSSGNSSCIFKVYVPTEAVEEKGLGVWEVTHSVGDWSVTCSEVVIAQCPQDHNATNFWTSHTTVGKSECLQQEIGVDIVEPGFP